MADDPATKASPPPPTTPPTAEAPPKSAGGFFLAIGCIGGAIIGGLLGQPSIGFLVGLAGGAVIAAMIWLKDR